jgi:hypothetical protein
MVAIVVRLLVAGFDLPPKLRATIVPSRLRAPGLAVVEEFAARINAFS